MKAKTLFQLSLFLIHTFVLASCGGNSNQDANTASDAAGSQNNISLSQVNMLLVGTLKLEGTDKDLTAEEAGTLLTLWQAYRSLSISQTAAEAEVEALLNQIQSSMTADQIEAIKAMNLTNKDMMDLMQTLGIGMGPRGTPNPQSTPGFDVPGGFQMGNPPEESSGEPPSGSTSGGRNFPPAGGVVIQGGPGGDAGSAMGLGGGPMLQGTPDPSMQATAEARFSTQANRVNSMMLDVLISKLEAKTTN